MFRILYHGPNKKAYAYLKAGLPDKMQLQMEHDRNRLPEILELDRPDGIIFPLADPGPNDLNYLKKILNLPSAPGILVTANYISAPQAVCCMKLGVFDCLSGQVSTDVVAACLTRMLYNENPDETIEKPVFLKGNSQAIRDLRSRLGRYGRVDHPVLITGETGSGKELAARSIHESSRRRNGPFVAVNCASYSEDLLCSELFGSRKGAYTGAIDRPGLIEESRGGILFLDEIGELSLPGQASLLRLIEENIIRRVGSSREIKVDMRLVSATNRNLNRCMKKGRFRPDLYYRLNLLNAKVPPLRKRKEDIGFLARSYAAGLEPGIQWRISSDVVATLAGYSWPGNVRELQSVILKATMVAKNHVIRSENIDLGSC